MTISIDRTRDVFGTVFIVKATLDSFHKPISREFYAHADAYSFCCSLLTEVMPEDISALFKRR